MTTTTIVNPDADPTIAKLVAAIRATPDDDAPRLVYADALEERGHVARANLVRLQCRRAPLAASDGEAAELDREIAQLLADHGPAWRAALPPLRGVTWTEFSRGFVTGARVDRVATLYELADAIRVAAPIERVELESFDESKVEAPANGLPWLRALRVTTWWRDFHVSKTRSLVGVPSELEIVVPGSGGHDPSELLAARGHEPLTRLALLGEHTVAPAVVHVLSHSRAARTLRELSLGTRFVDHDTGYYEDPTLRAAGAERLASATLDRIEVLDVSLQRVTGDGVALLASSLPRLRRLAARNCEITALEAFHADGTPFAALDLSHNQLGDDGARALATSPRLRHLEVLELDTCEITGAGVGALVESPQWETLRVLDLSRNPLGVDGALALAAAPRPPHLHALRLADCDLDADAARLLAEVPWLDQLATVDLSRNAVTSALIAALRGARDLVLAELRPLDDLRPALAARFEHTWRVVLAGTPLGARVALPAHAPELYWLDAGNCNVREDAARDLGHGELPKLRRLELGNGPLPPQAVAALFESPLAARLTALGLQRTAPTADTMARLYALDMPKLVVLDLSRNAFDEPTLLAIARSDALRRVPALVIAGCGWPRTQPGRDEMVKRFGHAWYSASRALLDPESVGGVRPDPRDADEDDE
jgi:uncharacterized protein (TIGR02996 family)|nr:TIGR02996 domain-containing protein [Kofleriaceae bacterium]